jgi:hypothetical protein
LIDPRKIMNNFEIKQARSRYEEKFSRLSDRQWERIRDMLDFKIVGEGEGLLRLSTYMRLKEYAPRGLSLKRIQAFQALVESFNNGAAEGEVIMTGGQVKVLCDRLPEPPHLSTLYRWGREMMAPFSPQRKYQGEQAMKWLYKIAVLKEAKMQAV